MRTAVAGEVLSWGGENVPEEGFELPGSKACVGCRGLTFRNRGDGLCPRCAWQAESLIEQIELDGLERDLALMSRFEAYCRQRDERGSVVAAGRGVTGGPLFPNGRLSSPPLAQVPPWRQSA